MFVQNPTLKSSLTCLIQFHPATALYVGLAEMTASLPKRRTEAQKAMWLRGHSWPPRGSAYFFPEVTTSFSVSVSYTHTESHGTCQAAAAMSNSSRPCGRTCQAPLSVGFSRQEYWSGLPGPPPGVLPDPGIKPASPMSPALAGSFFTTSATWEAQSNRGCCNLHTQHLITEQATAGPLP